MSLSPSVNIDGLVTTAEVMLCDFQSQAIKGAAASILLAGTFTLNPEVPRKKSKYQAVVLERPFVVSLSPGPVVPSLPAIP